MNIPIARRIPPLLLTLLLALAGSAPPVLVHVREGRGINDRSSVQIFGNSAPPTGLTLGIGW
ncbi:hypothetical protein [Streptomyces subrutilus]|uniref:hypothetical protein n=1 Tax=Streptomyces subrutilus TaxID=36818 RepID=UPI00340E1934